MHPFPNVMCGTRRLIPTVFSAVGNAALSGGSLTATVSAAGVGGAETAFSVAAGKFYAEFTLLTNSAAGGIGLTKSGRSLTSDLAGQSAGALAQVSSSGAVYVGGSSSAVNPAGGASPSAGDRWDLAVDLDLDRLWVRTTANGGKWNNSVSASPATNVGGIDISSWRAAASVWMAAQDSGASNGWTANFGQNVFGGAVPAGFNQGFGAI